MHPKTDIIVLVHNRLSITKGFVKCLFESTENFNLIFFDNGSEQETADYLEEGRSQGKWGVMSSDQNLGIIIPRNMAAQKVTSDYFVNLDNDQYPRPGWLEGLHKLMNEGYDVVGCEAWKLHPPGKGGNVIFEGKQHSMDYFPCKRCTNINDKFSYIGCGGMLIKKKVYDDIGLFDERFSPAYFEDPDFSFRCIQAGCRLGWKQNCPIDHLGHQTIASQSLFKKSKQFLLSWGKFKDKWKTYYPNK